MYENLSIVYDKLMDVDYDTYANIIDQELEDKKGLLILDLGCGSGTMIPYLKKYGEVFAVDNSEQMLSIASSKSSDSNFFAMDLLEISNLGYEFDFVLSAFDVFNYLPDFTSFKDGLKEVYCSLKSGGKFIFDIHTNISRIHILAVRICKYFSNIFDLSQINDEVYDFRS